MTETLHFELHSHALQAQLVWSKLVGNEGHLILQVQTVFCPFLDSHISAVTETSDMLLPTNALQALQSLVEIGHERIALHA